MIRGMVVQTEFHKPRGTYPLGKVLWENVLSFPVYERFFWNFIEVFLAFCQSYSLLVHRSTLRKVIFFEFFRNVFGFRAKIVYISGEKFPQRCQNCILRVQISFRFFCTILSYFICLRVRAKKNLSSGKKVSSVLSKLHSKRPRTFRWIIFSKSFVFKLVWYLS